MNKILATLLIAAALSMETAGNRADFSLNGNDKCVMVDEKITCQPMPKAPIRVASSESN